MIPTIPSLIQDNTTVIYQQMDGIARYLMSMVSIEWHTYCCKNLLKVETRDQVEDAVKNMDILSIMINRTYLTFRYTIGYAICKYNHIELFKILNKKQIPDRSIISIDASRYGRSEIIDVLVQDGFKVHWNNVLTGACIGGFIDLVKLAIANSAADLNTGLEQACYHNHMFTVQLLLESGVPNLDTGLTNACVMGHTKIVQLLLDAGAKNLNTALYNACMNNQHHIYPILINHGATWCQCSRTMEEHLSDINQSPI